MRLSVGSVLFAPLVLWSGCLPTGLGPAAYGRVEQTVRFDPDGRFRLDNVNGRIEIETWEKQEVAIEAEESAPNRRLLDQVHIAIRGEGARVEVHTETPHGGWFLGAGSTKVDYRVRIHKQARVEVKTVNGLVRVDGVAGSVRAETVNGAVRIADASGSVEAKTVNGSIQAEYHDPGDGRHAFSTVNGAVTLYLPGGTRGYVNARTVNGRITTDFPLQASSKPGRRRLQGRLGEGGGIFEVHTINGTVRLLKSPDKIAQRTLLQSVRSSVSPCVWILKSEPIRNLS